MSTSIMSSKLCKGDLIALHGSTNKLGYLCLPSSTEPIPEREERISHLRASCQVDQVSPDFTERCLFRIADEKGQMRKGEAILFGTIVRLIHEPSLCTVVANDTLDFNEYDRSSFAGVCLRHTLAPEEETAAEWYITPKFRLRSEGDQVHSDDFVVFRSVKFKGKQLTVTLPSSDTTRFEHLVGVERNTHMPSGWQLLLVVPHLQEAKVDEVDSKMAPICGGDYLRLRHLQARGVLLARGDDAKEFESVVAPLGLIARKAAQPKDHTHAVFVRPLAAQADDDTDDSSAASGASIWQISCACSPYGFGAVNSGSAVRLRNMLSGQFICVRTLRSGDADILDQSGVEILTAVGGEGAGRDTPGRQRWVVATTSRADRSSLFKIHTLDPAAASAGGLLYSYSLYFVHADSKLSLCLRDRRPDPGGHEDGSDRSVVPTDATDAVIHKEGYRCEKCDKDEVRDILFISKFQCLVQRCVRAVQNQPVDKLYLPLFRHLRVSIFTLATWVITVASPFPPPPHRLLRLMTVTPRL